MSPEKIANYRLFNQRIAYSTCKLPSEVVASLGAMQAQDYSGSLWAIGLRLPGSTEKDVIHAVADRSIVRTWPMRGTLHFVAAPDVRWMLALLTPRIIAKSAHRYRQLEIDDATFSRSRKVFIRELQGGRQLSRNEMYEVLERSRIATGNQRGYHILSRLAQEGLLCFGPHTGKQPTFTLLDEWVPPFPVVDREESLARLSLQYFRSHGPATLQDFVWWSGLKVIEAKAGLASISSQLLRETIGTQTYWMRQDMPGLRGVASSLYLLPGFDEYLLGYTDRSALLAPRYAKKVTPGNNGMFMPTVVRTGQISGIWKRSFRKGVANISVVPFDSFDDAESAAFKAAAERYGQFMGVPIDVLVEDENRKNAS